MSSKLWKAVWAALEKEHERAPAVDAILNSKGLERMQAIRRFYKLAQPEILQAGADEWGIDPYEVDWLRVFTPIEQALWHDIRMSGAILYPQYPVLGFFVDFGNPVAKVAVECDGAQYHQDAAKDVARQQAIEAIGWTVYRISGRECLTDSDQETGERGAAREFIDEIVRNHSISRIRGDAR